MVLDRRWTRGLNFPEEEGKTHGVGPWRCLRDDSIEACLKLAPMTDVPFSGPCFPRCVRWIHVLGPVVMGAAAVPGPRSHRKSQLGG